jgi:hypothetical protein
MEMDFSELFPDAPAQDYTNETCSISGGPIAIDTLRFGAIPTPGANALNEAAWIDGGSAVIVSTPSRAIALLKTCAVLTTGLERKGIIIDTALVSITATETGFLIRTKSMSGESMTLPATITREELSSDPEERALLTPIQLVDTLRALAEHGLACRMTENASSVQSVVRPSLRASDQHERRETGGVGPFGKDLSRDERDTPREQDGRTRRIVIKDGSLRTPNKYLTAHCAPKGDARERVFALAKTSALITSKARPLTAAIMARAQHDATNHVWSATLDSATRCVRLHEHARSAFLLESAAKDADAPQAAAQYATATLALLRAWSSDAAFLGYPYPLVLADQLARATNREMEMWRAMLAADTTSFERLRDELRASDTHDMLEHILYGKQMF